MTSYCLRQDFPIAYIEPCQIYVKKNILMKLMEGDRRLTITTKHF